MLPAGAREAQSCTSPSMRTASSAASPCPSLPTASSGPGDLPSSSDLLHCTSDSMISVKGLPAQANGHCMLGFLLFYVMHSIHDLPAI